jgi:PAS domain S-box-containing protein
VTNIAARPHFFDFFAFHRRSNVEQQNTAARPLTLRNDRLSIALCFGAIAIGLIGLTGYVLGNASITSLGANGKPLPVVTALVLIALGAGLLALRSPAPAGLLTARRAALAVIVIAAADLLLAALPRHIQEWQVWAARGGVNVHAYPFGAFLLMASASALVLITTRRDFAGHLIASAVLLICAVFSFAYVLSVPSFLDPSTRVLPVAAATLGLALISFAELLARPRGWVVPLLSRTAAGKMSRFLLPTAIVVPFAALALRALMADARWFTPEVGLTIIVVVNVFFSATIVLGAGVILHKRESDRLRLASIVDSSTDSIIRKSSEGLIETWNAAAERLYGYTAAEAIGRSITMLAPPELRAEMSLLLERVRRDERVDPFETVRVAKDGRHVDVLLSVSPVLDDAGNVVGASTIAHDITDRKRAEEALRESETKLTALIDNTADTIWSIDPECRLTSSNAAFRAAVPGFIGREIRRGDSVFTGVPQAIVDEWKPLYARALGGETLTRVSISLGGLRSSVHRETSFNPIREQDDKVVGVACFGRDITEREQAEEALRKSEWRYRQIVETAGEGIWQIDAESRTTFVNQRMAEMLGYTMAEMDGESIFEFMDEEGKTIAAAGVERSRRGIKGHLDVKLRRKDGTDLWAIVSTGSIFLDPAGRYAGALALIADVSDRKRAEEAVQLANERLQTLSHRLLEVQETERRQLARELHDEIGQALTAIKINLQTLKQFPDLATDASRIDESTRIVDRALGQVRTLSLELRPPMLDDFGLAAALRWLVDQHARRTGLLAEFRSGAKDARFDAAAETACFRVAQEALTNVARHSGARHVTVELQTQEGGLHLRVSDDGAGFDVLAARRRAAQGASFGLLGMEERATLAGGGIEWRSAPGEGTEVHAWFPLPRPAGNNDETPATA